MKRNPHPTKSGPGRRHKDGLKHGIAPPSPSGPKWLGQHTNPKRNQQRRLSASMGGARQYKRQGKALRRLRGKLRTVAKEST